MKISKSSVGFIALSILALAGCPVTGDDLCAKGTCEAAIDATSPDAADAGPDAIVVEPRDPCIDKPTAPECINEESAIFVSKSADPNTGDGTLTKPYASLATALRKVTAQKKRVYVCEGTYEEQISIESVASTLIGGLACDFRTPGPKAIIKPPSGIALGVAKVGGASVIDVAIEATSDVNAPGSSAVAVFVTDSEDILFRGVEITTGVGQPGSDGKNGSETPNHPGTQAPQAVGGNSNGMAGIANTCTACADGTSSKGGNGGAKNPMLILATGGDTTPAVAGRADNSGGSAGTCGVGGPGLVGEPAAKAAGGTVPGKLEAKSWTDRGTSAEKGRNGPPGQGGGGGGVATAGTGGGGSGACGGCGGTGGGAGTDGGSSIGALVYKSKKIVFERAKIVTAAGGKGGKGGNGQTGQEAPSIGGASGGGLACNGGAGGHGAGGGGGGGGMGGYSVAIAYLGEAPTAPESKLTPGPAGEPGTGGLGGVAVPGGGKKGEDGANGNASKSVELFPLE